MTQADVTPDEIAEACHYDDILGLKNFGESASEDEMTMTSDLIPREFDEESISGDSTFLNFDSSSECEDYAFELECSDMIAAIW